MKRLAIAAVALVGVGVAVVLSGVGGGVKTFFPLEDRNPVTHLRWNDADDEFRFAIVGDRTGGHRANVFAQAVEKLNLLQPEFVICVGDLIEGDKKTDEEIVAGWKELNGMVAKLSMPFFYVGGNHDVGIKQTAKAWDERFGRSYYHFVYRKVLFLVLNSDDPPGTTGSIGPQQRAYADKVLRDNAGVRWTVVIVHRPLWTAGNGANNGWVAIEKSLHGRPHTVFCGHLHTYVKYVRNGMNYYQLATTGGASRMRGMEFGEIDHFAWVTMKKGGPVLANVLVNSVYPENMQPIKTDEPGVSTADRLPTHPVRGTAHFEGTPMTGADVLFLHTSDKSPTKGVGGHGVVEADGTFKVTTYAPFDGLPAGEYKVAVAWRESGSSLLPARYNSMAKSGLTAVIKAGGNDVALELKK